jgi:hypothetical protein
VFAQHEAIIKARTDYELDRYDLVERLNCLDCKKKVVLSKAMQGLYDAYQSSSIFAFSLDRSVSASTSASASPRNGEEATAQFMMDPADGIDRGVSFGIDSKSPRGKYAQVLGASSPAISPSRPISSAPATTTHSNTSVNDVFVQAPPYFARIEREVNKALETMRVNSDHWRTLRQKLAGMMASADFDVVVELMFL